MSSAFDTIGQMLAILFSQYDYARIFRNENLGKEEKTPHLKFKMKTHRLYASRIKNKNSYINELLT